MNWTCVVMTCNCSLRDPEATKQAANELHDSVNNVKETVLPFAQDKAMRINEAYRAYRLKQVVIINNIARDIK